MEEGKGRERKEKGRPEIGEGKGEKGRNRAPKLLLNQGPSKHCYATGNNQKNVP